MGEKLIRNYDNENNLISRECSCCHKIKSIEYFNKRSQDKDGQDSICIQCKSEKRKQHRKDNLQEVREKEKVYRDRHKDKIKEASKIYRLKNKDKIREANKKYSLKNKDRIREANKEHYKQNKDKKINYQKEYYRQNIDKVLDYHKQYYEQNFESMNKQKKQKRNQKIQEALQEIKIEVEKEPEKYNYTEDKEIYGIIYLVHNIESNKYYVGQTTIGFDNRYPSGWLYRHKNKDTVKHDLELYGENSFKYTKIFKVAYSQYELDKLEAYYINYYNSYENGYNENSGNIFTNRGKEEDTE